MVLAMDFRRQAQVCARPVDQGGRLRRTAKRTTRRKQLVQAFTLTSHRAKASRLALCPNSSSSAFASFRSRVSNPSVKPPIHQCLDAFVSIKLWGGHGFLA
jgi:hypothetical protein